MEVFVLVKTSTNIDLNFLQRALALANEKAPEPLEAYPVDLATLGATSARDLAYLAKQYALALCYKLGVILE